MSSYWDFWTVVKRLTPLHLVYLLGLFLLPFIFWPWSVTPFEIPRVWIFQRWVELLVILIIIFRKKVTLRFHIPIYASILLLFFTLSLILSSILGADFLKSIEGNYYRGDGLMTFIHILTFFLITNLLVDKQFLPIVLKSIACSSILLSLFTVGTYIQTGYPASTFFGNSRFLAVYLAVTLPVLLSFSGKFRYISMFLQVAAIVSTFSLGGFVGVGLAIAGFLLWKEKTSPKRFLIVTLLTILVVSVLYFAFDKRQQLSFESRNRIFNKGFIAWQQRPLLGWGMANFDYAFENADWPVKTEYDVYVDKAHSTLLEILVTSGILSFILYICFNLQILKSIVISRKLSVIIVSQMIILYWVLSQTNIISISTEVLYWFAAAILLSFV